MSKNRNKIKSVAGIYIRLSKEDRNKNDKSDDSESIINQRRMLLDYCRDHEFNVYDIYNDEDFSGSDRDRPEFKRLIEDARSKKIDTIVCKTQSRFARDMEIVEKYINGLFPIWGVRFIGVVDNTDNGNSRNLKQRQITMLVDEWYISDLSENIRATLSSKRRDGLWVGAFAPYGYVKDPTNKNHLIIDDEAAETVRYIFSLYLSGIGIASIARRLNDEKIPNPATYKQIHGQPFQNSHKECSDIWHTYSIKRILDNEVYIGNVVQGMSENVSYKSHKKRFKNRDEWDIVEGVHEPIIDRDVWNRVRKIREGKPKSLKRYSEPNIFSGKVRCSACGGSMRIHYTNHKRYYRCSTKYVAADRCEGRIISEKVLKRTVLDEIRKLYRDYIDEESVANDLPVANGYEDRLSRLKTAIQKCEKDISQLDNRLKALYIDKLDGVITVEEFKTLKDKFVEDRRVREQEMDGIKTKCDIIEKEMRTEESRRELIKRFIDMESLDFETVQLLIDHIEIGGDRNNRIVDIHWNF